MSNIHCPGDRPDIFIFATPRSGSTFLEELLFAQPRVKTYDEPITVNLPASRREPGATTWEELATLPDREERYFRFFDRLRHSRIKDMNTPLYRPHGRLLTTRNVFKVIHGAEGMIPWFAETFNAQVVILIRHPIATALSHVLLPRPQYFLQQPPLRRLLSEAEVAFTKRIISEGDRFERSVLNWALQIVGLLRPGVAPDWAVVSYEDLTVHPRQSFDYLQAKLCLQPIANIEALAARPSRTTYKITMTGEFLCAASSSGDRSFLIRRWTERVSAQQVKRCFEICGQFGLELYEDGNLFPTEPYRVPRTGSAAPESHATSTARP